MINTKGVTYGGYVAPFVLYLIDHWSVIVTLVIDKKLPAIIHFLVGILFVFDVARYAFELTTNHLLNNQIKSLQDLMTYLGTKKPLAVKQEAFL